MYKFDERRRRTCDQHNERDDADRPMRRRACCGFVVKQICCNTNPQKIEVKEFWAMRNSLPNHVTSAPSMRVFQSRFNCHLFSVYSASAVTLYVIFITLIIHDIRLWTSTSYLLATLIAIMSPSSVDGSLQPMKTLSAYWTIGDR